MLAVQAEVGLVKVRSNVPEEDSVKSIKPSQPVIENVKVLPFALKSVLASIVVDAGSVNSVVSALTAAWLTVGAEGVVGAGSIVYVILAFIGDGPPVA